MHVLSYFISNIAKQYGTHARNQAVNPSVALSPKPYTPDTRCTQSSCTSSTCQGLALSPHACDRCLSLSNAFPSQSAHLSAISHTLALLCHSWPGLFRVQVNTVQSVAGMQHNMLAASITSNRKGLQHCISIGHCHPVTQIAWYNAECVEQAEAADPTGMRSAPTAPPPSGNAHTCTHTNPQNTYIHTATTSSQANLCKLCNPHFNKKVYCYTSPWQGTCRQQQATVILLSATE